MVTDPIVPIELRLLGPPALVREGHAVQGRALHRKNLAVLAVLSQSPDQARSREHLIGLLWGDKEDRSARQSLRQAIRDLKTALTEDLFETVADEVRLAPDAIRVDTHEFERRRDERDWQHASDLVRGEFMEGFGVPSTPEFDHWLSSERVTWSRRAIGVLLAAAQECADRGEVATAADLTARALHVDPHADAAIRLGMRCAVLDDNAGHALHLFETHRDRLREIGLDPAPETRELAEMIRGHRHAKRRPRTPSEGPTRRAPLVGRGRELETMVRAWTAVRDGGGARVVLVEGSQGMGKTRFADELTARVRIDGAVLAAVRAVSADRETQWSGLASLLEHDLVHAPGLPAADPDDLAAVAAFVPDLRMRFAHGPPSTPIEPAVGRVMRTLCEERPVVIVIDDAHHLDDATTRLVPALLRDLRDHRLLVVMTTSPLRPRTEIEELRARVGREVRGCTIVLRSLDREAIGTLARGYVSEPDGKQLDRLVRRIEADSAGIPLLAVELLHGVAVGASAGDSPPQWPRPGRTLDDTRVGDLPGNVVGAIRAGYWSAPETMRTILAVLAVLDDEVTPATLRAITGLPDTDVTAGLDWLEWERWLVTGRRGYTFAARLVREVIERDMVTPGQAERWRAIAARSADPSRDAIR